MLFTFCRFVIGRALLTLMMGITCGSALAATYPDRQITMVVPWTPGGVTDIVGRVLADRLGQALGQAVVVSNKAGASGNIGARYVSQALPDGYTLMVGSMSTHAINPALFAEMPFDAIEDFTPITLLGYLTGTLVVTPSLPVSSVSELIEYLKTNPGKLAYASAGLGSTNHLGAVMFEHETGTQMLHVPYKAGNQAMLSTVSGETQVFFGTASQTLPQAKNGTLRMLAVTEKTRSPELSAIPAVSESVKGYEMGVWCGLFGPAGMPPELVDKLNAEVRRILATDSVREHLASLGIQVADTSKAEFEAILREDSIKYRKIIQELGIKN